MMHGRIGIWIQKAHRHTDSMDQDPRIRTHNAVMQNVIKITLYQKLIVLTLLTGSRTNQWNILNIYNFSLCLPHLPLQQMWMGLDPF